MAKKAETPMAEQVVDFPCSFGSVTIGDQKAGILFSVDRRHLSISKADKTLCGRRLTVRLLAQADGAEPDQGALPGMEADIHLDGVCDVRSFRVSPKLISCGMSFAIEEIEVEALAAFAKRTGKIFVDDVNDIPAGEKEESSNGEAE